MKAKLTRQPYDQKAYQSLLAKSVTDVVAKQVACGIDFVTDGELSKPGFFTYIFSKSISTGIHIPGTPFYTAAAMLLIALILAQRAARDSNPTWQSATST